MNRKELADYITETYSVQPDFPFMQYPDVAVFRHENNRKWFAVIMNVQKSQLGMNGDGAVDIVNLKCDPILSGSLRNEKGYYPAYHMSKTNWISVVPDGTDDEEKIKWLIDISFDLTAKKIKKKGNKSDEF